jgi:hypothetical protein
MMKINLTLLHQMINFTLRLQVANHSTKVMLKRQDLHAIDPFELRVKMMRNRITLTQVARKLHVSHQAVSLALFGESKSLLVKIEKVVNKLIGVR